VADTRVQIEVEDWIRNTHLPTVFGQRLHRERVRLSSGGEFDFDGVSDDKKIVVSVSTSGASTASGKPAVGKLTKIRADVLFLLLAEAESRVLCLSEQDMFELCEKEMRTGRLPKEIQLLRVELPSDLAQRLKAARDAASREARPQKE
jgi:hypothetical protein